MFGQAEPGPDRARRRRPISTCSRRRTRSRWCSAQKAAIGEQLAQAKRNFEVGTATITDTHEAQARYDLIVGAGNRRRRTTVETKMRALQQITGKGYAAAAAAARRRSSSRRRTRPTCRAGWTSRKSRAIRW